MAAALRVQNTGAVASGNTGNTSLAGVQAGDMIVLCFIEQNGNAMGTPSSDLDGNLALAEARNGVSGAAHAAIWYLKNASAGTHVITVPSNGSSTTYDFNASAWSGCVTTGGADTTGENGGASTQNHNHSSITPSASSLIIAAWGCGGDNGGETQGSDGMSTLNISGSAGAGRQFYQYKTGHTGAIDGDFTTTNSVSFDCVIAAFLETGGGGGSKPKTLLTLGVG